jgi:hypothetical protein
MTYNPNVPPDPGTPPRGGGNRALYFIVGGLVVLAAVFVFIFTNNAVGDGAQDADMTTPAPAATEPAEPVPAPAPAPEGDTGGGATTNQ